MRLAVAGAAAGAAAVPVAAKCVVSLKPLVPAAAAFAALDDNLTVTRSTTTSLTLAAGFKHGFKRHLVTQSLIAKRT